MLGQSTDSLFRLRARFSSTNLGHSIGVTEKYSNGAEADLAWKAIGVMTHEFRPMASLITTQMVFRPLLLMVQDDGRPLLTRSKSVHVMASRTPRRHAGQPLENLLRSFFLDDSVCEYVHVFVDRHSHLFER
jgi:hypothetical protein